MFLLPTPLSKQRSGRLQCDIGITITRTGQDEKEDGRHRLPCRKLCTLADFDII